jgi:hypothetical protein
VSGIDRPTNTAPDDFIGIIVRQTTASLTAEQVNAIMYLTARAPERKPRNISQGVCMSRLSRHELAPGIYVQLTEETDPTGRYSPFRLTPLGLAVRRKLEMSDVKAA